MTTHAASQQVASPSALNNPEVDLERGLVHLLAVAYRQAVVVRDVQREAGNPAVGESVLASYLAEGLEWAVKYRAWRDGQWSNPLGDEAPVSPEDALSQYLRGD